MTREELKKLRTHYQVMRGQQRVLEHDLKAYVVRQATVDILVRSLDQLEKDFPGLVPKFDPSDAGWNEGFLLAEPVRAHVATVLGILEVQIADDPSPVVEGKSFAFVSNTQLRKIVERDYLELQRAFVAQCWKSVIILAGGTIEAVLTDLLLAHEVEAKAATAAPNKSDLARWDLSDLIDVVVELKLVSAGSSKLSHPIREYRNLVHPSNELRNKLVFGPEEARIALEVLHILHRDLSP